MTHRNQPSLYEYTMNPTVITLVVKLETIDMFNKENLRVFIIPELDLRGVTMYINVV